MAIRKHAAKAPDYAFISIVALLLIFGFVMLASASSDLAKAKFGDSYYYLTHQLLFGLTFGGAGFLTGMLVYYRRLEKWAVILLGGTLLLILLMLFSSLGLDIRGSTRWLDFGTFSFQPGELLKLTFIIYLVSWIARNEERGKNIATGLLPFLILIGIVTLFLALEPATTVAFLIFATALLIYFAAGAKFHFLVAAVLVAALGFSILVYATPYRLDRLRAFLNPSANELGSGYHINQALLAIGSGGATGVGFGQSTTKLHYLPEPIGDSIFAVIAEELGFIGGIVVVALFLLLVWRGLVIARAAPDTFGRLLATGFSCMIGLQAFVNIGAISGLIPLTGVSLPFVSYGGTALAVFLTMSGIIVNISRYRR